MSHGSLSDEDIDRLLADDGAVVKAAVRKMDDAIKEVLHTLAKDLGVEAVNVGMGVTVTITGAFAAVALVGQHPMEAFNAHREAADRIAALAIQEHMTTPPPGSQN